MFKFITLATNDLYAKSALVLNRSIKNTESIAETCILIPKCKSSTISNLSENILDLVYKNFDHVILVDLLNSENCKFSRSILEQMNRPELSVTLTKLHCFNLENCKVGCFIDADCLVVRNIDEIFNIFNGDHESEGCCEKIAAAPEFSWPDSFNSGLFVFKPSKSTFKKLMDPNLAPSYDGGDQGFLNQYFGKNWVRLSVNYNLPSYKFGQHDMEQGLLNANACSPYMSTDTKICPATAKFANDAKVVHFLGGEGSKPWNKSDMDSALLNLQKDAWQAILRKELGQFYQSCQISDGANNNCYKIVSGKSSSDSVDSIKSATDEIIDGIMARIE